MSITTLRTRERHTGNRSGGGHPGVSDVRHQRHPFCWCHATIRWTSIGDSITGKGGNRIVVDDPHNPLQAESSDGVDAGGVVAANR